MNASDRRPHALGQEAEIASTVCQKKNFGKLVDGGAAQAPLLLSSKKGVCFVKYRVSIDKRGELGYNAIG